jgi:hypothetical protein
MGGDHPDRAWREIESPDREAVDLGRGFQRAGLVDRHDLGQERGKPGMAQLLLDNRERVIRQRGGHQSRVTQDMQGGHDVGVSG